MAGRTERRVACAVVVLTTAVLLVVAPSATSVESAFGPGSVALVPASVRGTSNCIPFGSNVSFGFSGFVYRNVPPFRLEPGGRFAFDLGGLNDVEVRRDIYFAPADVNPATFSTPVRATTWTRVASEEQSPMNPFGNTVIGDYELTYTSEAAFDFAGGGLVVGFGRTRVHFDNGCQQVVVHTDRNDASGVFHSRFWNRGDQTSDFLHTGYADTRFLAGMVVYGPDEREVRIDVRPDNNVNPLNVRSGGVVPVALLSEDDFDTATVDIETVRFGATGEEAAPQRCQPEDVNGDGLDDLVCQFRTQDGGFSSASTGAKLTGDADGTRFFGTDTVQVVGKPR